MVGSVQPLGDEVPLASGISVDFVSLCVPP